MYLDSGDGRRESFARHWLENNLQDDIREIRIQSGYYWREGLNPHVDQITKILSKPRSLFSIVVGANDGILLADDLKHLFGLINLNKTGNLIVVRYNNAKFHPKCYHLVRDDGSSCALVGSANFTSDGLGINVEACLSLDTKGENRDSPSVLESIQKSIDAWSGRSVEEGAFKILSLDQIDTLTASGTINKSIKKEQRKITIGDTEEDRNEAEATGAGVISLPSRKRHWKNSNSAHRTTAKDKGVSAPARTLSPASVVAATDMDYPCLVAEIPKAGTRWEQANFDLESFTKFFELDPHNQKHLELIHINASGASGPPEQRLSVAVRSQNYRVEIAAAKGVAYPTKGRPICIFSRTATRHFNYRLFMPGNSDYARVLGFMNGITAMHATRMRRIRAAKSSLVAALPGIVRP
jgi:hypothetical protein